MREEVIQKYLLLQYFDKCDLSKNRTIVATQKKIWRAIKRETLLSRLYAISSHKKGKNIGHSPTDTRCSTRVRIRTQDSKTRLINNWETF